MQLPYAQALTKMAFMKCGPWEAKATNSRGQSDPQHTGDNTAAD